MTLIRSLSLLALLLTLLSRTALAVNVQDSLGTHHFDQTPARIAVLNWDLAEQLLELGITPIAMPRIDEYRRWVARPAVPDSVADLGSRAEPNLEMLARLKPDLILIASPQLDMKARLEQIAPVLFFQTYSAEHDNVAATFETFRQLAALTGTQQLAEQKLQAQQQRMAGLKQQLHDAWQGQLPAVATIRFASPTSIYLYGDNSTTQYAMARLGLTPALPQASSQWGVTQTRLLTLRKIDAGVVLYFKPFDQEALLKKSPLWQAMPFVRQGQVNSVAASWTYGGAMSVGYIADALAASLLEIAPE